MKHTIPLLCLYIATFSLNVTFFLMKYIILYRSLIFPYVEQEALKNHLKALLINDFIRKMDNHS